MLKRETLKIKVLRSELISCLDLPKLEGEEIVFGRYTTHTLSIGLTVWDSKCFLHSFDRLPEGTDARYDRNQLLKDAKKSRGKYFTLKVAGMIDRGNT